MTFKLLVLPNLTGMRPAVLNKIKQLVAEGGAIYGPKPTQSPNLQGLESTFIVFEKSTDAAKPGAIKTTTVQTITRQGTNSTQSTNIWLPTAFEQ